MLVLSRKEDDVIVLTHPDGTRIEVVLVRAKNGSSKIGIEAPPHIRIIRKEIEHDESHSN